MVIGKYVSLALLLGVVDYSYAEKCNVADDCNAVLTMADDLDPSIKGACTMQKQPGTCLIFFVKGGAFELNANVKDDLGPKCKIDAMATQQCKTALTEVSQPYPNVKFTLGKSYQCGVRDTANMTSFTTCSVQAVLMEKESGTSDISGPGCDTAMQCEMMMSMEDAMKAGVSKTCFSVDRKCTAMCARGCGFVYGNFMSYHETARSPGSSCMLTTDTKVVNDCKNFAEELKMAIPFNTITLFNSYICTMGSEMVPTCSVQAT